MLKGVKQKEILLVEAEQVENWAEARFYTRSAEFLAAYHQQRSPIVQIIDTERTPFAVTKDKHAIFMVPVDEVRWTELVATAAVDLSKQVKPHSSRTELWVGGRISSRAQKEFARMGWSVFDRTRERLKSGG